MFARSSFWRSLFLLVILSWLAAASLFAQDNPQKERPRRAMPSDPEPQDVIKVDTDLVPLDVVVTDSKGRLVRDLKREDFKLFEDNVERPIASFNVEKIAGAARPLAIVFALDMSGSMTSEEIQRVASAMREFSARLAGHPAVFGVMTFGMHVKTLQSLTADRGKLERAFDRLAQEPNGMSTHTYDAVDDAVRMLARHAPLTRERQLVKRAVVVTWDATAIHVVVPQTVDVGSTEIVVTVNDRTSNALDFEVLP